MISSLPDLILLLWIGVGLLLLSGWLGFVIATRRMQHQAVARRLAYWRLWPRRAGFTWEVDNSARLTTAKQDVEQLSKQLKEAKDGYVNLSRMLAEVQLRNELYEKHVREACKIMRMPVPEKQKDPS